MDNGPHLKRLGAYLQVCLALFFFRTMFVTVIESLIIKRDVMHHKELHSMTTAVKQPLPENDLLVALPIALVILDAGGRIVWVNPAAEALLGFGLIDTLWHDVSSRLFSSRPDNSQIIHLADGRRLQLLIATLESLPGELISLIDITHLCVEDETARILNKLTIDFSKTANSVDNVVENPEDEEPVAQDSKSQALLSMALRVAGSDIGVMISGESGTGKEVLAHYIHDHSPRSKCPFVAINCAAIPEQMLEATLFGYEKGAFTGAYKSSQGKFEQAQGGTLLLDEVSEMSLGLQAKLLRVIQEKEVERLGGNKMISLDVRILATSNRHLEEEVQAGRFREDLFYRLNVFPLQWLPLRERIKDIIPLAHYLLRKHCQHNHTEAPEISKAAERAMLAYLWPGNARELDNVIQRALVLQTDGIIETQHLHLLTQTATKI